MDDVSVIIPTWNSAKTLPAAIQGALGQSHPVLEVFVCDDGSTDDSARAVASLNDPRVVWLPGPHSGGPGGPRNRGMGASRGEWLAVCDSDDEWLPEKIGRQLEAVRRRQCLAVGTNAYSVRPGAATHPPCLSWDRPEITFDDLLYDNPVVCSSALFHRSLLPKVGGFPEDYALRSVADYTLWLRVATFTRFAYVVEPSVNYWNDPAASLRAQDDDIWTQKALVFANYLRWAEGSALPEPRANLRRLQARLRQLAGESRRRKLRTWAGIWKRKLLG